MSIPREPEAVIARLRSHGRALFWPICVLIADSGSVAYFGGTLPSGWPKRTALIAAAIILLLLVVLPVLRWLSRNYTITTRRVVIRSGVLVRHRQELLHSRVFDVTLRQSGLQHVFRTGDILVNASLDRPVELRDVATPRLVQSALQDLMEVNASLAAGRRQDTADMSDHRTEESR